MFENKKLKAIKANTLYSIAKDFYKEQETEELDIPYFIKAYNYTNAVIKNGLLNKKFELLTKKQKLA